MWVWNFIFCWPCISIQLLVGDQFDAQFFYIMRLFQSSTCFEQTRAHHQEVNYINTASGIVTLCQWLSGKHVEQELLDLHTGQSVTESDYTRCCINTIDLLTMSTCLLETCRGLKWTYYIEELCIKLVTYQKWVQNVLVMANFWGKCNEYVISTKEVTCAQSAVVSFGKLAERNTN